MAPGHSAQRVLISRSFRVSLRGKATLLYIRYRDMRSRAHGRGTKCPWTYPPGWPACWDTFEKFRAWALAHGFSKVNNSPDRPRPTEPYGPNNVVWKTPKANFAGSRGSGYYGAQPPGPEPPLEDHVPF